MSLDIQPVLIFADGTPVSSLNPLPTTGGGGGGGTVDQGAANGDATKGWSARLTDGAAFIVPAKTGQLPAALGTTTAAGSVSVGIATDQLSTLATAAKQDTGNASLATIATQQTDGTQKTQVTSSALPTGAATSALQGAGLPAALVGGKLDVNLGTSSITLPVSGPLTDAQLRATPVPVSGTVTVTSTTVNQGTGAGAAAPWSIELSDGAAFYTGAKTGQFPTSLGQTTRAASLSVALASDQVGSAGSAATNVLTVQGVASMTPVQVGDNSSSLTVDSTQLPAALGQTTAAGSLSIVLNSNQVGTAGSSATTVLSVQGIASGTNLPVSQATASALNATVTGSGSAGTAAAGVVTVQGIASMTPVQVSQATAANLNATVAQGAGSGSAATFWYARVTDGTNTMPTMDAAARSGYQRVTDGTNTATVKAASTVPTASDTALVVSLSPNSKNPGGSSFAWFSTATGSTIKSGAGVVRRVIVGSNVTGTVTLYDNTAASGTVICSVTSTTSTPCNYVELNAAFSTGLHCVTTGSGISVTVVYD